jgi:two-component system response regulator HydG
LCRHFMTVYAEKLGRAPQTLSPEAVEIITRHDWPGNVRELENVMVRAVTLTSSHEISADEFRRIFTLGAARAPAAPGPLSADQADDPAGRTMQSAEKEIILRALQAADGNQTKAAQALEMGRNTLWRKMKKYGIDSRG